MKIGNIFCWFFIIALLKNFEKSHCESPLTSCPLNKPFKIKDGCANFTDICIKSDDSDCKRFLTACEQCPPSNMTHILLLYIQAELNSHKSDSQLLFKQLENKVDLTRGKLDNKTEVITILLISIIVINIILMIVLFIEIGFKLIKKDKEYQRVNNNYPAMEMENFSVTEISKVFDEKLEGAMSKLKESLDNPLTKFKIDGVEKIIELQISVDDCIVKIKKLICEKMPTDIKQNYKTMKLKFMDKILDDNKYLFSQIGFCRVTIFCQFINNINPNDYVVLQLCGNQKLPEFLQVNKNLPILQLKTLIKEFISTDFVILKRGKQCIKLDDNLTVDGNNLHDQDVIKILTNEIKNFEIRSIFNEKDIINIKCDIMDSVSKLSELAAETFNSDPKNFILFLHHKYLLSNRFIYEFEQECKGEIKYCCLRRMNLPIPNNATTLGDSSEIYKVNDPNFNTDVILKRYQLLNENLLKEGSPFINELITFQIAKQNSVFVKLLGVYKNESHLFISLEYLENGSLKEFIAKNGLQTENVIAKWSKQILEGLKYLHENKIIHRDLKPSNIFLDENNNIKLSGFDLTKFAENQLVNSRVGTYRYMAPEIHKGEPYGYLADVWSFGVTLVELATGIKIFSQLNEIDFVSQLLELDNITWKPHRNNSKNLIEFINMCLVFDPQQRATPEMLLTHPFLKLNK